VDVGGDDPEIFTLFEEPIQLFAMADATRVLRVYEHRRTVVRADLVERVAGEILIAHDLVVGEFVEGFLHPLEIGIEFLCRRFSPHGRAGLGCRQNR